MTRNVRSRGIIFAFVSTVLVTAQTVNASGNGQQTVTAAAEDNQFAFIMFYRGKDTATQNMYDMLTSTLSERSDAAIVPVRISDASEAELVKRFDATRIPMPALAVLAPNGAVCSVLPRRVTEQQILSCIVSPGQAECLKALQNKRIVALCAQPAPDAEVPEGVHQFQADELFRDQIQIVTVLATDPEEAKFLKQLRVPANRNTPVVALMAPPGVMVGVFNSSVTHTHLSQKLIAAGKCCDDENCRHRRAATAQKRPSRRSR